jgi:hypothetical protein
MCGSWPRGSEWWLGQSGARLGPKVGWTGWPGPSWAHFGPSRSLLWWCCFPSLLECSPICMWALDVSFSAVYMKLLVLQDAAFSVWVLGVFRLHRLVLGLLGVMFTSLLDLCRASRSCHKVLDELYPKVSLSTLNSCMNTKLQYQRAQTNLLYQGG